MSLASSSASWVNPVGGVSTLTVNTSGNETQIRWGQPPDLNGAKSGLGFAGSSTTQFDFDNPFLVGTLRHFNYPVSPPSLTAVQLLVNLNFSDIGGVPLSRSFTFDFNIDETPNQLPCQYESTVPCADKISFANTTASETIAIANKRYTLELLGFRTSPTGALVNDFISQEGGTNEASLYGKITATSVPESSVPEPTAIAALFSLGVYLLKVRGQKLEGKSQRAESEFGLL